MIKYKLREKDKKEKEKIMRKLWRIYDEDEELLEEAIDEFYDNLLDVKYDEEIDEQKKLLSAGLIVKSSLVLALYNSFKENSQMLSIDKDTSDRIYSSIRDIKKIEIIGGVKFGKTLEERIRIIDNNSLETLKNAHSMYINKDITIGAFIDELAVIRDLTKYQYKRLLSTEYANTINKGDHMLKEAINEILFNKYHIVEREAWKREGIKKIKKEEIGARTYEELINEVGLIRADIKEGEIEEQYIYNAILDEKTCGECEKLNGNIYNKRDIVPLPQHPHCRCYYDTIYMLKIGNEQILL